jgi:hypothetical protein
LDLQKSPTKQGKRKDKNREGMVIGNKDGNESHSVGFVTTPTASKVPSSSDSDTAKETRAMPVRSKFQRGDHVYQWCSVAGVPRAYQHHGIVMHARVLDGSNQGQPNEELTIADFSNFLPDMATLNPNTQQAAELKKQRDPTLSPLRKRLRSKDSSFPSLSFGAGATSTGGILRVYTTTSSESEWHVVKYNAPRWKTLFYRSGVITTVAACDSAEVVLNRVNFLLVQAEREANDTFQSFVLPKYHVIFANCECVATWCKTGKWSTLQGASFLAGATISYGSGTMAFGQAAAAGVAAQEAVALASTPGLLSYFTRSSMVPLASSQPWIVPVLTVYGAVAVGGLTSILLARSKWKTTTQQLNEAWNQQLLHAAPHLQL